MDPLQALRQIAFELERGGAPTYRVQAFRRAAAVLAALPEGELELRVRAGTLQALKGIGDTTAQVVTEAARGETPGYLARLTGDRPPCREAGVAVEINCRPEREDPPDRLLKLAAEAGCVFAVDTDAHAPGQLDWLVNGTVRAEWAGITADRVINARGAAEMLSRPRGA